MIKNKRIFNFLKKTQGHEIGCCEGFFEKNLMLQLKIMMKFILVLFFFPVFAAGSIPPCRDSAKPLKRGSLSSLCSAVFVRKNTSKTCAEIKLEKDLEDVRKAGQEQELREQGFLPSYYAGLDQVQEFKKVQEYLEAVQADPYLTHVPYFSNQAEKTISQFEKSFREQMADRRPDIKVDHPFLKRRLKLLDDLRQELKLKTERQEVTYHWWAGFNVKLVLLSLAAEKFALLKFPKKERAFAAGVSNTENFPDFLRTYDPLLNYQGSGQLHYLRKFKKQFPKKIIFFSAGSFGIMAFNRMTGRVHLAVISGQDRYADNIQYNPFGFFMHDLRHIEASVHNTIYRRQIKGTDEEIIARLDDISDHSKREKAELALFLYFHEGGHLEYNTILENISSKSLMGIASLWSVFMKSSLKGAQKGESVLKLSMTRFLQRDLDRGGVGRYEDILPGRLRYADKKRMKPFIEETAALFAEVFSDMFRHNRVNF